MAVNQKGTTVTHVALIFHPADPDKNLRTRITCTAYRTIDHTTFESVEFLKVYTPLVVEMEDLTSLLSTFSNVLDVASGSAWHIIQRSLFGHPVDAEEISTSDTWTLYTQDAEVTGE